MDCRGVGEGRVVVEEDWKTLKCCSHPTEFKHFEKMYRCWCAHRHQSGVVGGISVVVSCGCGGCYPQQVSCAATGRDCSKWGFSLSAHSQLLLYGPDEGCVSRMWQRQGIQMPISLHSTHSLCWCWGQVWVDFVLVFEALCVCVLSACSLPFRQLSSSNCAPQVARLDDHTHPAVIRKWFAFIADNNSVGRDRLCVQ